MDSDAAVAGSAQRLQLSMPDSTLGIGAVGPSFALSHMRTPKTRGGFTQFSATQWRDSMVAAAASLASTAAYAYGPVFGGSIGIQGEL